MKLKLTLAVLLLLYHSASSLFAYDCNSPTLNATSLSLLDTQNCQEPIGEPEIDEANIQVVQAAKLEFVQIIQCKIEVYRLIRVCGILDHMFATNYDNIKYIRELTRNQCLDLYETKRLEFYGVHDKIATNASTTIPVAFAGSADEKGYCHGQTYSDTYGTWDNVFVSGHITITLRDYYASVNVDKNKVYLQSGLRCPYLDGKCLDVNAESTFWSQLPKGNCNDNRFSVLYDGKASRISYQDEKNNTRSIYSVTNNELTFAFSVVSQFKQCNDFIIETEHPRIYVLDKADNLHLRYANRINSKNTDLSLYINAKLTYLEKHLKTQLTKMYRDIIKQECELERKVLQNALIIATLSPDEFALQLMKKQGYIAHVSGEVLRVAKCVAVIVSRRDTDKCYLELPITRGEEPMFMMPRTHILVRRGTEIDCTPLLTSMYKLDGGWFQFSPQISSAPPPMKLAALTNYSWEYEPAPGLATKGIYSLSDIEKYQEDMMFSLEKSALLNNIIKEAASQFPKEDVPYFDQNIFKRTFDEVWDKVYNFFNTLGSYCVTIFGVYVLFRFISILLNILLQGQATSTLANCGLRVFNLIWLNLSRPFSGKDNVEQEITPAVSSDIEAASVNPRSRHVTFLLPRDNTN